MKRSKDIWLDGVVADWEWANNSREEMNRPSCENCHFWIPEMETPLMGDCGAVPPLIVAGVTRFPNTDATTWCGSWRANVRMCESGGGGCGKQPKLSNGLTGSGGD